MKTIISLVSSILIFGSFAERANAAVVIVLEDAGFGTTNMTIAGSGVVATSASIDGTYFNYITTIATFHGSASYENIFIDPVLTGEDSAPLNRLRIRDDFGAGSMFQLWTGVNDASGAVASPFDLSSMNGTYSIPVDFSLLNEGSWNLTYNLGIDVGPVTLTVLAVPEPSAPALLIAGAAAAFTVLRRRKK